MSGTRAGVLSGAIHTDASHANIYDIAGDQHITYNNAPEDTEMILARLKPVNRERSYVSKCLEGTRKDIFRKLDGWLDDVEASNVLWVIGGPGAGKSAIASSLVSKLIERGRLGSSFFFRRGDVMLSDPAGLWRTVAHDMAQFDPSFARYLVEVLKEKKVDPEWPDIGLHFKFLIEEPLRKAYDDSLSRPVPVIIIDALDECDSDRSPAHRKDLINTLTRWSSLPKKFKLIITGRDERVPEAFRTICEQIPLPTGDNVNDDANHDIRCFFEESFAELGGASSVKWPGKQVLDALTERAAGLFIWAETVLRFVKQGLPDKQLRLVLDGDLGEEDNITKLYKQVLEMSFREFKGQDLEDIRLVIAAIVLAKVPFRREDLHKVVGQPDVSVRYILGQLSSVIAIGTSDQRVRFGHLSFIEFLCDAKRCPERFVIDKSKDSQQLMMGCFRLMKDGLKFNICDLETSHVFNWELPNETVDKYIPTALKYACHFWAAHLLDTKIDQDCPDRLMHEVEEFFLIRFLFWLEVMSLTQEVSAAKIALATVIPWIQVSDQLTRYNSMLITNIMLRHSALLWQPLLKMPGDLWSHLICRYLSALLRSTFQRYHFRHHHH